MELICINYRREKKVCMYYPYQIFTLIVINATLVVTKYIIFFNIPSPCEDPAESNECCRNLVISGSDDVKDKYPNNLGLYKFHQRLNKRNAYQIPQSSLMFQWVPEHHESRIGWSVRSANTFRLNAYSFRNAFAN